MITPGTPPVPHVGGPISVGSPNVLIGSIPAARVGDMCVCVGPPDVIAKGSVTVLINNMPAVRIGDLTAHGGTITVGFPTVLIGDSSNSGAGGMGMKQASSGQAALRDLAVLASGQAMTAPEVQRRALIAAAASGAPFCEVCQAAQDEAAQTQAAQDQGPQNQGVQQQKRGRAEQSANKQ
jgi:uncharacterized Zn-binding protein involved in type VI secretion